MTRSERWVWHAVYVLSPLIIVLDVGIALKWW